MRGITNPHIPERAIRRNSHFWGCGRNVLSAAKQAPGSCVGSRSENRIPNLGSRVALGAQSTEFELTLPNPMRPRGPLGLILMSPWPAKICEHPITHELCDMALEPGDLARH